MIKRFSVLKGIGRFSTLNSTRGTEGDFSKLNVIYASNACGKSTLCDLFRSLGTANPSYIIGRKKFGSDSQPEIIVQLEGEQHTPRYQNGQWHDRETCPPIHVYDDRFVAENVFIGHHINVDQRRNLYGLVIGDQAATLNQAVYAAEEQLNRATAALAVSRDNIDRLIPTGFTIDSFRNLAVIEDVDNKIAEATSELRMAEQTKTKVEAIRARKKMSTLPVAMVPETLGRVLGATLDTAALAAEAKIREHLAKTTNELPTSWAKQGFESQTGTICPYCGQEMQGLEILETYRSFFSRELETQEQLLVSTKSCVSDVFGETAQNQLKQTLASHRTEQEWWKDVVGYRFELTEIDDVEKILDLLKKTEQSLISALERKRANPGKELKFTTEELSVIALWDEKVIELKSYNEALEEINAEILRRQAEAESIDLIPIQQRLLDLKTRKKRHEQESIAAYVKYDTDTEQKTRAQQEKQRANEALRDQSNQQFRRYGERINDLLRLFAVDFRIVSDGVTFRGGPPSGQLAIELCGTRVSATPEAAADPSQPSLANTLSSGDRSALALAYFLAKVELATDVDSSIVVFDDPYHNQDRSRRQCTIERIHSVTGLCKQCFVFSHDLDFARAVEKLPGIVSKTFVLDSLCDPANILARALPLLPSQAYIANYNRLHSFLDNPSDHLQHLKEIVDTLRVILEEYLRFKFPKAWAEKDWLGDMIRKIREARVETPLSQCQSLVEELGKINNYSQGFHHGSTGTVADEAEARELKTYVERTLKIIHAGGIA